MVQSKVPAADGREGQRSLAAGMCQTVGHHDARRLEEQPRASLRGNKRRRGSSTLSKAALTNALSNLKEAEALLNDLPA